MDAHGPRIAMALNNATTELADNSPGWQRPEYSWGASLLGVNNSFSRTEWKGGRGGRNKEEEEEKKVFQAEGSLSKSEGKKKKKVGRWDLKKKKNLTHAWSDSQA